MRRMRDLQNRCEQDIAQPSFTESDVEAKKKAEAKLEKLKAKQEKSGSRVAWLWHGRGTAWKRETSDF